MWKRRLRLILALAISGIFLFLFFRGIDLLKVGDSLRNVGTGWWLLILAALVQVLHVYLRAARWRILLGPMKRDPDWHNMISTISIGYMVTMFLPGRIGEVLRPVMFASREKISKSGTIATILLERLMDALTVCTYFAVYLIFFLGPAGGRGREAAAGLSIGWGVTAGAAIVLIFPVLFLVVHFRHQVARMLERVVPKEGRAGHAIHGVFHGIVDGFEVLKGVRALVAAWGYSFLIWGIIAFSIWFSVRAFGIDLPLPGSLLMLGVLTLGIAIPTQGGVGTYEWFGQQGLTRFFGVDPSQAAAAVMVMHVFAISPVILMGLYFLWRDGLSFSGLTRDVAGASQEDGADPAPSAAGPAKARGEDAGPGGRPGSRVSPSPAREDAPARGEALPTGSAIPSRGAGRAAGGDR